MKIIQTDFFQSSNLGIFGKASDKFCLIGKNILLKRPEIIQETLKVEIVRTTLNSTDIVGIFSCLNSNAILLPKIVEKEEAKYLKNVGLNVGIINSKYTCIGNLILSNDKGAIASKLFKKAEVKKIEDYLQVEVVQMSIAGLNLPGACGVANNKGCILHIDATEEELKAVENVLKVKADVGTANFGSPFLGSCIIANSNGALVGKRSTGAEINRIVESLQLF